MRRLMALLFCFGTLIPRQTCAQNLPDTTEEVDSSEASSARAFIRAADNDSCIVASRLSALVIDHLGNAEVPFALSVQVFNEDGVGFFLLRHDEAIAERRFDSVPESCDARHAAFAVVIALAIEHAVTAGEFDEPEPEEPEEPSPTEEDGTLIDASDETPLAAVKSEAAPEREDNPERSKKKKWRRRRVVVKEGPGLRFNLGAGFISKVIPEPALYAVLGVAGYLGRRFTVGTDFLLSEEVTTQFPTPEGRGGNILADGKSQMRAGRGLFCWEPLIGDGSLGLCSGVAVGSAKIAGRGGFQPEANEGLASLWLAGVGRAGLRYPARGPGGIHLAGDFYGNIVRPGLELTGDPTSQGRRNYRRDAGIVAGGVFVEMFLVLE